VSATWRFSYHPSTALPALAWIARVADGEVNVHCGTSVRLDENGFVEGTWVGSSEIETISDSTAVFGSAMVARGDSLIVVPPSHPLERVFFYREGHEVTVSNSLAAVIETCGLELDPDSLYPPIFVAAADGVSNPTMDVPTNRSPITTGVYYNFGIGRDGALSVEGRPRERPFSSFEDFRDRATAALRSAVANAPGYEMAVSLSSGYDSTAVAALAAPVGCRLALSFREGKPVSGSASAADTGESAAQQLGMAIRTFDRLAYLSRDDLPEAEFLATGMSGEDVVVTAMEQSVRGRMLLTGAEEFRLKGGPRRSALYRGDLSSCSLTEFRLRVDFVHVPLLFFGASEKFSIIDITDSPQMRPWTMPGLYDKPMQRRLAEEGGVARGTFATVKRRASATIHRDGLAAMAPPSAAAVRQFALAEGREVPSGARRTLRRRHRLAMRTAKMLDLDQLAAPLTRRKRSLLHAEPALGSLLFRWAVSVVRSRYTEPPPSDEAVVLEETADLTSSAGA
jgi:hypothetical protein